MTAARHVGRETSALAEVEPVVDSVPLELKKDPRTVPLATKKELLDRYNETMLSVDGVTSTNITYSDGHKRVIVREQRGVVHRAGAHRRRVAAGGDRAQERRHAAGEHEPRAR